MSIKNHLTIVLPIEWYRMLKLHSSLQCLDGIELPIETRAIPFKPQRLSLTEVLPSIMNTLSSAKITNSSEISKRNGESFNVDVSFSLKQQLKVGLLQEKPAILLQLA